MPWTTRGRALALRSVFGADKSSIAPATLYLALFKGDPAGSGTEPTSTGSYARVAKTNDATLWGTIGATDTAISNVGTSGAITWPAASAVWSITDPLTHWAIFDNSSGGNMLASGTLSTPITITGAGDQARIPAGAFTITQEA